MGAVDLGRLDVFGLLALSRFIGITPIPVEQKPYTQEVLRKAIEEHAMSA